ncbi:MAG: hypothetical protein S4CHLAM107_11110 [Chlamydiia bacterium]|nr:hypothetical protein [Chlamydiia bacterium]
MLFLSFLTFIMTKNFQTALLLSHGEVKALPYMKQYALITTFIVGIFFALLSKGGHLKRTFMVFFPINLILLLALAGFLRFSNEAFQHPFFLGATFCFLNIAAFFPVIFTWGFANQNYSFKTAALHYPFLMILLIPALIISPKLLPANSPEFSALVLFFAALIIFLIYLSWQKFDLGAIDPGNEVLRKYYAGFAAIVFFIPIAKHLITLLMRAEMKALHTTATAYTNAVLKYAPIKGLYEIYFIILGIILGIVLYFVGRKAYGWIGALIVLALTACGVLSFNTPAFHPLTEANFAFSHSAFALFLPIIPLFMLLGKELAYFGVPHEKRFTAKLVLDILIFTLATDVGYYIPQILLTYHDANILHHAWIYFGIFIICMAASFRAVVALHRGLQEKPSQ